MTKSPLQTLFDYWNGVRGPRLAPRRLEIEPAQIAGILARTFMLERGEDDVFRYRLAGTGLCEIFGGELRGADFLEGWAEPGRTSLLRDLRLVCDQGAVLKLAAVASLDARHAVDMEALLVPLVHAGTTIGRVMGVVALSSEPHWLGHVRLTQKKLIEHDIIWPDGRPHAVVARAAAPQPFMRDFGPVQIVRSERRTFRVLQGGRSGGDTGKA